ncbi:hypothetical protein K435DRAFT_341398 [Dendrothele bispora CBS 962.96]|uniref:Uncharacterized protein n=1 Tax=Dendrothele bispora (strain CBS 962.96) TaxID=1314807 RepID=A0A4V4HDL2_DENBC|nr:hypothetical protein K435DRAFT_341398 [Dendrothele bispora CBS 962.96]
MSRFGDFEPLCTSTPSYTWCNLFYRQLRDLNSTIPNLLPGLSSDPSSAPMGINPKCGIPLVSSSLSSLSSLASSSGSNADSSISWGSGNSLGNIANIIACGLSIPVVLALVWFISKRKAAVGRVEMRILISVYGLSLILQILTTTSVLEQGSTALVVLTAIHAGVVAAWFWMLLANGMVATQFVDDGSWASLMPFSIFSAAIFAGTTYISLDVALHITDTLGPPDRTDPNSIRDLKSIPLFVLTSIWPLVAALLYFGLITYIVLRILNERKPFFLFLLSAILFVLGQLAWFLLGRVVCAGSNAKVDGSFINTILETAAIVMLFMGWRSITEGEFSLRFFDFWLWLLSLFSCFDIFWFSVLCSSVLFVSYGLYALCCNVSVCSCFFPWFVSRRGGLVFCGRLKCVGAGPNGCWTVTGEGC